jgi:flagellar biosynthetic protein FliR
MAEAEIFKLFLLVMVRVGGLFVTAPVLSSNNFPLMARAGMIALIAMLVTPTLPALRESLPAEPLPFGLLAIGELFIGVMLGFLMLMLFGAIQLAGQIMDLQTGFGMMNVFNPALETQFPIFGFFLFILAVLYLLVFGGHRMMIWSLCMTYQHIPIGGFVARPALMWEVTRWGRDMFVDGIMISAPVATAMLLAYATMGLLGRVVPQIQLFVVGFPITIATGLFITAFTIGAYIHFLDGMFARMFRNVDVLIRGMG